LSCGAKTLKPDNGVLQMSKFECPVSEFALPITVTWRLQTAVQGCHLHIPKKNRKNKKTSNDCIPSRDHLSSHVLSNYGKIGVIIPGHDTKDLKTWVQQ
jgi:hypothetical protein